MTHIIFNNLHHILQMCGQIITHTNTTLHVILVPVIAVIHAQCWYGYRAGTPTPYMYKYIHT